MRGTKMSSRTCILSGALAAAQAILLILWLASGWICIEWGKTENRRSTWLSLDRGALFATSIEWARLRNEIRVHIPSGFEFSSHPFQLKWMLPILLIDAGIATLWLPIWLVCGALGIVEVGVLLLGRRRATPNACRCCGYDLRLNESGICPECGTRLEAKVPTGRTRQNGDRT